MLVHTRLRAESHGHKDMISGGEDARHLPRFFLMVSVRHSRCFSGVKWTASGWRVDGDERLQPTAANIREAV